MPSQFAAATTAANAASTALHTMYVSHTLTQAALPSRRGEYEARWAALEAWPDGRPVTWSDVPWPPCRRTGGGGGGTSASAAPPRAGDPRDTLQLEPEELRRLLFAGATGPAAVKAALRRELMRWRVHPRFRAPVSYTPQTPPANREVVYPVAVESLKRKRTHESRILCER